VFLQENRDYYSRMDYKTYWNEWTNNLAVVSGVRFKCGHCGADAGVINALQGQQRSRAINQHTGRPVVILFCPVCSQPTYCDPDGKFVPAASLGAELKNLPAGISGLYREARACSSVGAYTACVMVSRKILMNLSVLEGAPSGQGFIQYVDYLSESGFVPPRGKAWVDRIRAKGNEANHEIEEMSEADAREIMMLVEMLLRFNFELGTP